MPLERELKFRLAPRAAARAATELPLAPGVLLSSIYFDTPSRELSHARASLRLRRVGRAWLQTFKCERGPGVRGEWELGVRRAALDLSRFPAEEIRRASGIDLASLNGRLAPLFETRFTRRAADIRLRDAVVEVALDRGAVIARKRREPLLELEIELKNGDPRRLPRYAESLVEPLGLRLSLASKAERGYRLALAEQPAPRKWRRPDLRDAKPHDALARLASVAFEQVVANAEGVLASADPEYLHQLRVGLRRLRSLFAAFRALDPRPGAVRRRLRPFGSVLGASRDWDVFAGSLRSLPPAAKKARAKARALIASPEFQQAIVRILRWIEDAPWRTSAEPLDRFAARSLDRLHRKAVKEIDWDDAGQRHRRRVRVKRLRYAADAFADCFPSARTRRYLAALERLQDGFGELNDIAVARRLGGGPGLDAREKRLIVRVRREWAAFEIRAPFWRGGKRRPRA
jgi:inorganic triphosphatase YgiF